MNVNLPREVLLKSLQSIQGIVESRNTMPVLGHFLLETEDGAARIHATDLDIGLTQPLDVTIEEPGAVCIPAKKFYEIIREIPDETIRIDVDAEHRIHLHSQRSRFKLIGLPKTDFPELPKAEHAAAVVIDQGELSDMIARTVYATGEADTRYTLNGILIHVIPKEELKKREEKGGPTFRIVGTDGHRLAIVRTDVADVPVEEWKLIVTKKAAQEIRKLAELSDTPIRLLLGKNHLMVEAGETRLICRLVDGTYPNYEQVLPKGNDKTLTVNREEFLSAVRRVSLLGKERTFPLKVDVNADTVVVSSVNPEVGEAVEELSGTLEGEPLAVGFNARYLQDAVSHMRGEEIQIDMADSLSPTLIREKGSDNYQCVIMPMRI